MDLTLVLLRSLPPPVPPPIPPPLGSYLAPTSVPLSEYPALIPNLTSVTVSLLIGYTLDSAAEEDRWPHHFHIRDGLRTGRDRIGIGRDRERYRM